MRVTVGDCCCLTYACGGRDSSDRNWRGGNLSGSFDKGGLASIQQADSANCQHRISSDRVWYMTYSWPFSTTHPVRTIS